MSDMKRAPPPHVKLCNANGKELKTLGCYSTPLKVGNQHMTHDILFINNLQISCILGMDFPKPIHLPSNSELSLKLPVKQSFPTGLIESCSNLPDQVMVILYIHSRP